jgi:hypothetical protein
MNMISTASRMHKLVYLTLVLFLSCSEKKPAVPTKPAEVYYPFSPRKDVDFQNGNKKLANIVLNIWRGYTSGNVKGYRKYFADSLKLVFNDKVVAGQSDSVLNIYQQRRNKLSTLQAHIDYWQPVYEKEKNENWVLLWVTHEGTKPDKKLDSYSLHQVWKFDGSGKIFLMQEYRSSWDW